MVSRHAPLAVYLARHSRRSGLDRRGVRLGFFASTESKAAGAYLAASTRRIDGLESDHRVIGPKPDGKEWAFAPGSVVTADPRVFPDGWPGPTFVAMRFAPVERLRTWLIVQKSKFLHRRSAPVQSMGYSMQK
jgi:hypothetical protein